MAKFLTSKINVLVFLGARGVSVASKPLLLWYLLMHDYLYLANILSLYFLSLGSLMVIFNNEAHFDFYKRLYGKKTNSTTRIKSEIQYYENFITHFQFFLVIVFLLVWLITGEIKYAILFFVLICLEKGIDEVQRYLVFSKEFLKWSILIGGKTIAPFIILILVVNITENQMFAFESFFVSSLVIFVLLILNYISVYQLKLFIKIIQSIRLRTWKSYYHKYRQKMILNQLQSIFTRNIPLTDRLIVRFLCPNLLAEFSFLAQIGSIPILVVDFFLISTKRKEYLDLKNSVLDIAGIFQLIGYLIFGFGIVGAVIYTLDLYNLLSVENLNVNQILLIGLYFSVFSVSQHFANYNFWKVIRKFTLLVDMGFFTVSILIFILLFQRMDFVNSLVLSLTCSHTLRFVCLVLLSFSEKMRTK